MTRARKVDPAVLEREYVYDPSPKGISLTELAERHGLARSGVADKAISGKWFEKRNEFRRTVGMKVVEAISDDWAVYATAQRSKMVDAMVKTLDKYMERLESGEIKPGVRDAVSVAGALRVLIADISAAAPAEDVPLDPTAIDLTPAALAEFIETTKTRLRALPSGEEDGDDADFLDTGRADPAAESLEGDAPEPRPTGTEGTRQN